MNTRKLFCLTTLALLSASSFSQGLNDEYPGSLWPKSYKNPLLDRTARTEGDILTVLISETSAAQFNAGTTTSKKEANNVARLNIPIIGGFLPALGTSGDLSSDGKGTTSQNGKLVAKMTVIVKKVMENGTMVIEGTRSVQVNKETQTFKLSGIVRLDDIRSDNTVLSENIAEAEIKVDGKGAISDRQRRGFLSRILDWIF
ncbi:MAG: flagellar basal body L-ring protein FlgH [Fimbriimonadaceae bacterium]|nr:flagellar basal body L-ring protein FlgH [Fimbriimonadaceae bacterium]